MCHYIECKQWFAFNDNGGDMVGAIYYCPDSELYHVSVGNRRDAQEEIGAGDTFANADELLRAVLAAQLDEF